jgi:SEC-C motif-containing protein
VAEPRIDRCPCGAGLPYDACCSQLHAGKAAGTAEQLMRSRYAAFAVMDTAYLLRSWHSSTRPSEIILDADQRWTGLTILATSKGGLFDQEGTVEFRALYSHRRRISELHERSQFLREDGAWAYVTALPG